MAASYYACSVDGCPQRSVTEKEAIDHYHSHFVGKSVVVAKKHPVKEAPRYKSKIANAIDRGSAKVRKGIETYNEVSDAINSNFNFDAAFEGMAGGLGINSVSFDDGLIGNQEEEPGRLPNKRQR